MVSQGQSIFTVCDYLLNARVYADIVGAMKNSTLTLATNRRMSKLDCLKVQTFVPDSGFNFISWSRRSFRFNFRQRPVKSQVFLLLLPQLAEHIHNHLSSQPEKQE